MTKSEAVNPQDFFRVLRRKAYKRPNSKTKSYWQQFKPQYAFISEAWIVEQFIDYVNKKFGPNPEILKSLTEFGEMEKHPALDVFVNLIDTLAKEKLIYIIENSKKELGWVLRQPEDLADSVFKFRASVITELISLAEKMPKFNTDSIIDSAIKAIRNNPNVKIVKKNLPSHQVLIGEVLEPQMQKDVLQYVKLMAFEDQVMQTLDMLKNPKVMEL